MSVTKEFLRLRGGANLENQKDQKLKLSTSKLKEINFVVNMLRYTLVMNKFHYCNFFSLGHQKHFTMLIITRSALLI